MGYNHIDSDAAGGRIVLHIKHTMRCGWIGIAIILASLLNGCGNGSVMSGPDIPTMRYIDATPWHDRSNAASLTISAYISVQQSRSKDQRANWLTKVELDFGDGAGWIDATQYYLDFLALDSPWTFETGFKHTYTVPGDYVTQARATFWDGEVVYSIGAYTVTMP
jgi:hypothetical protein